MSKQKFLPCPICGKQPKIYQGESANRGCKIWHAECIHMYENRGLSGLKTFAGVDNKGFVHKQWNALVESFNEEMGKTKGGQQ